MAATTPFLARLRETDEILVVIGFDERAERAICAGVGIRSIPFLDLEVVRAAVDWPRPNHESEEVDRLYGPRATSRPAPPRSEVRIT